MKRLLAKFGWALARRFDPVRYEYYDRLSRSDLEALIESIDPSDTPFMEQLNHRRKSLYQWDADSLDH